jgi:hypothetical protein
VEERFKLLSVQVLTLIILASVIRASDTRISVVFSKLPWGARGVEVERYMISGRSEGLCIELFYVDSLET